MLETTLENIPIKKILNAFEAALNVEEGKQDITLFFDKKYGSKDEYTKQKISTSPESFLDAKKKIAEKIRKGYILQQVSVGLMKFDDEICHFNLLREEGNPTYKLEEDLNHEPPECTTSCCCDEVCKAFYKALTNNLNIKKF